MPDWDLFCGSSDDSSSEFFLIRESSSKGIFKRGFGLKSNFPISLAPSEMVFSKFTSESAPEVLTVFSMPTTLEFSSKW